MAFSTFGISALVLFVLASRAYAADYRIRLLLQPNSATKGILEVFHDDQWALVCEDRFDSVSAKVACKQLGYDAAENFVTVNTPVVEGYGLDEVKCGPNDITLHKCPHKPWKVHDCGPNEKLMLTCSGGTREAAYNVILNAQHYWSCDYFASGAKYNIKNEKYAVVHGTATQELSPINSGFHLKGKSSWVNLGDFSADSCLNDPSTCELTVSFWVKILRATRHRTYLLGNRYNNQYTRGFSIYMEGHRLRGYILGSQKHCYFYDYHFSPHYWFHFAMVWPSDNKRMVFKNGGLTARRNCGSANGINYIDNGVYIIGADETMAGNANRDLDVAFDELAIWNSKLSETDISKLFRLAQDKGTDVSFNQLKLELQDVPWNAAYNDQSSVSYTELKNDITNQLEELYNNTIASYQSFEVKELNDRNGTVEISLSLRYSSVIWENGYYLQKSFWEKDFLNSRVQILDCESHIEFCSAPRITSVSPYHDGQHVNIRYQILPEHLKSGTFNGVFFYIQEINGSYTRTTQAHPTHTNQINHRIKLIPSAKFTFAIVATSYYGRGFLYGDIAYGYTSDASPRAGPSYVNVNGITQSNATVTWGTIPHSINGELQKYSAAVYDIPNEKLHEVFVDVTEERIAQFEGLFPGKQYNAKVCGFTKHPTCGTHTTTKFKTLPILPGKAAQLFRVVNVEAHKVHVRWEAVALPSQNGHMEYYDLRIKNLRTDSFEVFKHHDITNQDKINFQEVVADLKGLTPYQVYVALVNEVGMGPAVNITFTTLESVPSEAPQNFTIVNTTSDTITVAWSSLDIEVINGILLGYRFHYKNINLTTPWKNIDTGNSTLALTPVITFHVYELRLCGFTAVGEGIYTETAVVFVPGKVPLDLPVEARTLVVQNDSMVIQNDSMVIQWRYITPTERPAHFFIITATRVDTNITEVEKKFDTLLWRQDVYQYTVRGLKEFKWYDIRMAAGNPAGMGPFLVDQVTNRTLEGVPSASPRNLTAGNDSSTSMYLQWRPVLYEYADGIILGHIVYFRLKETLSITWESLQVNGSATNATVYNLEKFKDYDFKVSAFNSVAEGVTTSLVVAKTDEDVPGHPPLNVVARNTSSRSLLINWEPVPPRWHFGIIRGYEVLIKDTNNGTIFVHEVPVNETSLETGGLERYTNYTIQVTAFTIKGNGNFSKPIIAITDEDIPSKAPRGIVCLNTSSSSLSIYWSVLPVPKAHGIVRGYKIFLNRSDGRENTRINTAPWDLRSTSFSNLDEFVNYTAEILGITIKGEGVLSEPVHCLTDQDIPKHFPQDLHGYNTSDTSIMVLWKDVPSDHQNGIITGYSLFYNTTLRNGNILYDSTTFGTEMERELTDLLPFQYYDIQVAALTSKGLGTRSNSVTILTEEEAPKIPPGDVKGFNTSSTSIKLLWQQIPFEKVGGILRGYKIFWEEINFNGSVILQNETRLDNASITSLVFSGLTKYQEYRFRILAFTKFDGVNSTVAILTDEDTPTAPPFSCSGYNISKNAIQVIWDVVPRLERNGIIVGYNVYSDKTFNHATFLIKIVPNTSPLTYFKHYNLTVISTTLASPRSFVHDWLIPYTDYSFQVAALTSKGEGPRCQHFVVRTEEEAPRYAPGNLTLRNTSSTSLKVTWSGVNISLIRGIFHGYNIWFTAKPQFPDAYVTYGNQEARRKRRAAFVLDKQLTTVDVGHEIAGLSGLAKYTNYSIQVMALSKFVGVQSISVQLVTDEDKPSKVPQNIHGYNLSSTSLQLKWNPVQDGFVHGILRGYRLYYRITKFSSMPYINITYDSATLAATLDDLLMFTRYTLQITAFTSKGEGPYTQPIIVSTDEDVANKSPFGFKVTTLIKTHEIPMSWQPVPNGFLNGILIGYRVKMRQFSEGMEDIDGKEIHFDIGPDTLSFTARNLPNFATYTFQVVSLTKYGEGTHSSIKIAKTCPCEKKLTTNWFPLPPYTNKTEDEETGIFPWLINNLVTECCRNCYNGHGWTETLYKIDGKGSDGFKYKMDTFKSNIDDDTDFNFPVQGHYLKTKYATFYRYVYAVASPGVAFFIVDDPPDKMPNAVLSTVSSSWSLLLIAVIMSIIAGIILWFLDTRTNEVEFPNQFSKGVGEGFWWAFISMTTVGYGDRTPQSIQARIFAMVWVLTGLILTSILMGTITNALTSVTFASSSIKLYGTKVAAIEGSPSHRIGIRRNAKINEDKAYNDAFEIQADLASRKVKGALLDGYMAGSYNQLFEDERIRVHQIIDYKSGYGIVLGGRSKRLQKCFQIYIKRKRSYIIDHVATEIKTVKKNPKSAAEDLSTNLFNPKARIFVISITVCLSLLMAAIIGGFILQFYFKRRFRNKVENSTETYDKIIARDLTELLESFRERISLLKHELRNKHINELRVLSGFKRKPVKYVILANMKMEDNSEFSSQLWNSKAQLITSRENDLENPSVAWSNSGESRSSSSGPYLEMNKSPEIDAECVVESKPGIEELQREAYMAGLKAQGNDRYRHPYANMYRYLWVEKDL